MSTASSSPVGVIMLDTRFPRFVGDIGNHNTWPFDVLFEVVPGASARTVVENTSRQNLQPFIDAGQKLQNRGALGITTSCGFLTLSQSDIALQLNVPFVASSLAQVPWVQALLPPGKRVGIMTIHAPSLTDRHLRAAGIPEGTPIQGTEYGTEFTHAILNNATAMNQSDCEKDNVTAAIAFTKQHHDLGAIVLECTNMAPYANAINKATGLPVYSIYTLICWLQSGLSPASFMSPT